MNFYGFYFWGRRTPTQSLGAGVGGTPSCTQKCSGVSRATPGGVWSSRDARRAVPGLCVSGVCSSFMNSLPGSVFVFIMIRSLMQTMHLNLRIISYVFFNHWHTKYFSTIFDYLMCQKKEVSVNPQGYKWE